MSATSTSRVSREERREAILNAARRHFVSTGYHGTGMDDVANTLGLSKPIVYQYFSSKHDLYLAVLEKAGKNLQDTISTALNQSGSNRTIVRASVRAFFDFVDDDMQYYRLLFDSDMLDDIEAAEHVEQVMSTVVTYIAHHRAPAIRSAAVSMSSSCRAVFTHVFAADVLAPTTELASS